MSKAFDFRSIIAPKAFLTVFNPNANDIKKDFNGNTYTFPAEATVDITEAVGRKHNREGEWEEYVISPAEIVSHFLGEDGISGHLGPLGFRVLSGDPAFDEQIKADAREVCKERLYINDLATKNAHMAAVRVAKEAGNPAPTPERYVVEAMTRIAEYEAGGNRVLPFSCQDCAMPFLTQEEVSRHQEAQHKGAPVQAQSSNTAEVEALRATVASLTDLVKTVVAQASAKKGGRPRKEAQA